MVHECCEHTIGFNLDDLAQILTSWEFPFERTEDRISTTVPGRAGPINFHMTVMSDGEGRPCMMRLLSYAPDWSPASAGLDGHALLHYFNHRNAEALLGRHFLDEATGKAAFEITVYSSHGVFEDDLKDLVWFAVNEADETVTQLDELARVPHEVH